ncbi:DUF1917 domain-containing protein [Caballeronia sp. LZ008]|uniref:putative phosphothreonine lyase domain-containing protein n=1 Tax=unclassified Caballeronia TaxID=2646786 RepID=UPI0020295B1A|nr:putative phosphothreonine lyase domain-containg protein [Caballeronia sp. LZ008]MDR5798233.1 DUF1917 domain-containing protein [Caballeronia sp. LZ008]
MNEQLPLSARLLRKSDTPSEDLSRSWHLEMSPLCKKFISGDMTGKWCIFVSRADVDAAWNKIKHALEHNQLLCAKVSTALHSMAHGSIHVICVYTDNWTNLQDLMHARDVLRTLGFTEELGYKRDVDTQNGRTGSDEWYLRV